MKDSNRSYTPRKSKKVEVSDSLEIDHTKEEVLVNVGDTTKCGSKVSAIVDKNRVMISNKEGAKVVNKSDIEIV